MTRYYVMSDSADDLMWEDHSLVAIRREVDNMIAQGHDHHYFPLSVQVEAPRSPYRRRMQVIRTYHLDGTVNNTRYYVRENGEAPR